MNDHEQRWRDAMSSDLAAYDDDDGINNVRCGDIRGMLADLDAARAERDALQLQLNMRPTMKMDQCETYCETAQRLVAEQDALRVALAATDHLYDGDGFVRTCYEYDDNQAAWNAMEFARKAALKEPRT